MMNFTALRQYYRGFQPRPQDYTDNPNVGETSVIHSKSAPTPQESSSPENEQDKPILPPDLLRQIELGKNRTLDAGQSESLPIDSFTHWRQLYCEPRGQHHNYDDSGEVPEVLHRPDVPEKGEYVYRKNWQHRFLDMVNYPLEKRRKLTGPELTELVDPILMGFPNPLQVLWDFGLIELTEEAVAKRYPKSNAG
jgi:hypothetical protein